jgi:hypothetical protein
MNWRRCGKHELEMMREGLTEDVGRMNWMRCGKD